jgi:hypothetical protein
MQWMKSTGCNGWVQLVVETGTMQVYGGNYTHTWDHPEVKKCVNSLLSNAYNCNSNSGEVLPKLGQSVLKTWYYNRSRFGQTEAPSTGLILLS